MMERTFTIRPWAITEIKPSRRGPKAKLDIVAKAVEYLKSTGCTPREAADKFIAEYRGKAYSELKLKSGDADRDALKRLVAKITACSGNKIPD